jgi:hypothetical protein
VRHADFSGDLIDQALLAHVISDVSTGGVDLSSTSAFGSLSRLRRQCRVAKEQLSATSVTTLPAELPGYRGEIRVTRMELDNEIRTPLTEFIGVVRDTMERNGIRAAGLVAVASVGGGARIPAITTTLSEHLRVPVVTDAQPELTAATGALIRAGRGPEDDSRTTLAAATPAGLAAGAYSGDAVDSASTPSLAWSEVDEVEEVTPTERYDYAGGADVPTDAARPQVQFDHGRMADGEAEPAPPWYRRPAAIVAGALLGVLAVVTAVAVVIVRMVGGVDTVSGLGEVFLEPSSAAGADPFSPPVATPQPPATNPGADPAGAPSDGGVRTTSGELPGLYGGTRNLTTCEPETLIAFLAENPDKARAWAGVFGITPEQIPAFVRELTPVLLRTDTRVTNHGFANGQASPRQSVLEAGTAVLVDKSGSPRVRCYCGNPLLDPVATAVAPVYTGAQWSKFAADTIVVVRPAPRVIDTFVLYDPTTGTYFGRPRGGTGPTDIDDPRALTLKTTQPPAAPPPPPPRTRTTVYEAPPPVTRTHTLAPATPPITEVAPTTEVIPTTTEVPTATTEPWPTLTWLPPITDYYPPPEHPESQYAPAPEEPLVPTTTIPMDPHGGY